MYDSEEGNNEKRSIGMSSSICRLPPSSFNISFKPSNDFEKGMGVAVIVDGILCTSEAAAIALIGKRVEDLHKQWISHVEKM